MAEKYPEFYIRKRQKEETYRRIVQLVVGVAVLLVVGGVGGFFFYKYVLQPKRLAAPEVRQLADERQELATQSALASAGGQSPSTEVGNSAVPQAGEVLADLGDIPYDPSFPAVHIGVEGSNTSVALEGEENAERSEAADEAANSSEAETPPATTPPSRQEQSESFERRNEASPHTEEGRSAPADSSSAQRAPDDNSRREEQAAQPNPTPAANGDQSNATTAEIGAESNIYHVYAGSYGTREEAEKVKNDLQALGFQGQIVDMDIEFHIRVATMDDYEHAKAIRQKLIESGFPMAFATRSRD